MMGDNENVTVLTQDSKFDNSLRQIENINYIEYARTEFNKNRKFIIRRIPPVTYEEIKEYVGQFSVSNISISKKCRHAIVTLLNGAHVEEAVHNLNNKLLLGTVVEVSLLPNENLLCVTHLPFDLPEIEFRKYLEPFGILEKCFLMKDLVTGASKGYGFVEYVHNREKSIGACAQLDGRRLGSCIIQCAFLNNSVCHFEQLQSRCLLIDSLPDNYQNIQELKNICSIVDKPDWFKVGEKDGVLLQFAVVGFCDFETAEQTQKKINGLSVGSNSIRVTYCRPGDHAKVLHDEILNMRLNRLKTLKVAPPLLPTRECDSSIQNLNPSKLASPVVKKLLADNLDVLGNFIQVLQILQLQQPNQPQTGIEGPLLDPNMQIALLAVLISIQIQHNQQGFLEQQSTQEFIMNNLQNKQKNDGDKSLKSPFINWANTMVQNVILQNYINSNNHDFDNGNLSDPRSHSFYLFPENQNYSFEKDSLKNFSNIISALTPKHKVDHRTRIVKTNNQQGLTCNHGITANSQVSTSNKNQNVPSLLDLQPAVNQQNFIVNLQQNKNSLTPSLLDIPFKESHSSAMWNTTQGFIGPHPSFEHRQRTNVKSMGNYDTGLANPFLASYIESQIKMHVAENQTMKNTNLQKPISLLDLPLQQRNAANPATLDNHAEAQNRLKIKFSGSIQCTPLSRNKVHTANLHATDKRILCFESHQSTNVEHGNGFQVSQLNTEIHRNGPTQRNPVSLMKNRVVHANQEPGYNKSVHPKPLLSCTTKPSHFENRFVPPPAQNLEKPSTDLEHISCPFKSSFNAKRNFEEMGGIYEMHHNDQLKSLLDIRVDPLFSGVLPSAVMKPSLSTSRSFQNIPTGFKRKSPHLIPSPEASPDGSYIGQHSQGLGGHYATSYSHKRIKIS